MDRRQFLSLMGGTALGLPLAACAAKSGSNGKAGSTGSSSNPATGPSASNVEAPDASGLMRFKSPVPLGKITTRGQTGEVPVWYTDLQLTKAEVAKLKAGKYKAALVWHTSSPFMDALTLGAKRTFAAMGIQVVSVTNANLSDTTLASNLQTVLALRPDVIITIALDATADAVTFKPAVDQGVKLVFASVKPQAYRAGKEYVSVVTSDIDGLGIVTADAMGKGLGGKGDIGFIYYDANFFITNRREKAFLDRLASKYPGIKIVNKQPMADVTKAEAIASDMLVKNPTIKAIFAPWDSPVAESVVSAVQAAGRNDVEIYTIDLGNTNALNMAKGGIIKEETSQLAVELGNSLAIDGAYGLLNKKAPEMVIVPAFPVDKSNLKTGWESTFGVQLPQSIASAR
jgi:ribose transport system substrate-binding protein